MGLSPTQWIAIITFVLAVIATTQAIIYGLMLRTTHRVERAYVYVDGIIGLEGFDELDKKPTIVFKVRNSGRTPARILAYNAMYWPDELPKRMPLDAKELIPFDTSVVSNQEHVLAVGLSGNTSAKDIEMFKEAAKGLRPLFVFGRVVYRDRFQWFKKRYANFCFKLTPRDPLPTDAPGTHSFGFDAVPEGYNDADW